MHDCLIDGQIGTRIRVDDRSFLYGHGIFETIACETARPVFWKQHVQRLRLGCDRLKLTMPDEQILLRELQTVAASHPLSVVRISLSATAGGRGYAGSPDINGMFATTRVVSSFCWPREVEPPRLSGVTLPIADYRLPHNRLLSAIKHNNRLDQVLAASEPALREHGEGVLLDQQDYVISTLAANLFLVSAGQLITPRLDRVGVHGTLRAAIIAAFTTRCEKRRVTVDFLNEADEVFLCNSIRGVWPVTRVGDRVFPIGTVTREVQDWLASRSRLLARPA